MGAVRPPEQQDGPPPVHLSLAPSASGYRPGETVTALLSASTPAPEAIELQEVEMELTGVERVDTSWVSPAYRKDAPALNTDRRKVQRLVLQSRLQAATQGAFADSSQRRFIVRFQLPTWLPPTFRGTAVRYAYWLQARVAYRELAPGELAPQSSGGRGPPSLPEGDLMPEDLPPDDGADDEAAAARRPLLGPGGGAAASAVTTAVVRIPLHVWPLRPEGSGISSGGSGGLERASSSLANGQQQGSQAGSVASTPGPSQQQGQQWQQQQQQQLEQGSAEEVVPIKCWEIGPGTQVQDAISHIAKLAAVPAALRPSSPGKRLAAVRPPLQQQQQQQQQRRPAGMANGAAGPGAEDGQSEISYDGAEQQQHQQQTPAAAAVAAQSPQQQQQQQQQSSPGLPPLGPGAAALRRTSISRAVALEPERSLGSGSAAGPDGGGAAAARSYALRIGEHPLVRVSLHPPLEGALQPGATMGATLEFPRQQQQQQGGGGAGGSGGPAAAPRCMQVLVLLETEEVVEAAWRPRGSSGIRRVWDEHSEVTGDAACTHLLFTLPPDAAPSFATPLVQLRWLLRFQLTASTLPAGAAPGASPLAGKIDTLTWTLPLAVCSPRT